MAFVIDDLASVQPWRPRMIEIRGVAEILPEGGSTIQVGFGPEMFGVRPRWIVAYAIDGPDQRSARSA